MNAAAHELLERALGLPTDERAELVAELASSLEGEPGLEADPNWRQEIERRARRAWAGESSGADAETVFARVETALAHR